MRTLCTRLALLSLVVLAGAAFPDQAERTAENPVDGRLDSRIQGEYLMSGTTPQGDEQYGIQVVALGGGEFTATRFRGGLPGAGAEPGKRIRTLAGHAAGGKTIFVERQTIVAIPEDGPITVKNSLFDALVAKIEKVQRTSPTLGKRPPAGAVVLFDGTSTEQFEKAARTGDRLLKAGAVTRHTFKDFSLHLEFCIPLMPTARGNDRGHSGVTLPGPYEIQILDSFGLARPDSDSCGAICGVRAPDLNMCFPPLAWQTFDIDFLAARYDSSGKKVRGTRVTIQHNGQVVQDDIELPDPRSAGTSSQTATEAARLGLVDHGSPVRFRNIWVQEER